MIDAADQVPTQPEPEDPFARLRSARPWLQQIEDAQRSFDRWQQMCDNVDRLYAQMKASADAGGDRQFHLFWANMEVIRPSIYTRPPVPVVSARFKDRKPLVRHGSEILERSLISAFEVEDIDATLKLVRNDLAMYGRGVSWVRYADGDRLDFDHVDRRDFVHEPARKWKEVGWVARRAWLTREQMRDRFEESSEGAYQLAQYRRRKDDGSSDGYEGEEKAEVWEIWSKTKRCVVWVTPGSREAVLDISEPFLDLANFFPCPPPAYGTLVPDSLKPVPDLNFYKDQIEEINDLTSRIAALSESLRVKGFYPAGASDIAAAVEKAFNSSNNGVVLEGIANLAAFGNGSLKDSVVWLPVQEIATTIVHCVNLRRQLIDDVYQLTGLSDIMRGMSDAGETATAQRLKSQYGSIRISDKQGEMVRVARDLTRIAAEIMSENFAPESLMRLSQYEGCPPASQVQQQVQQVDMQLQRAMNDPQMRAQAQANPQQAQQMLQQAQAQKQKLLQTVTLEQVFAFLREQRVRPFVLDIETDSTIQPDEDAAKQRTAEFLGAMGSLLPQVASMIQAEPATAPFAGELLKFGSKQYRAGRELDGAIDELIEGMKQKAGQPRPNPEQQKLEAEKERDKARIEFEREKHRDQMAFDKDKADRDRADKRDEFLQANGVMPAYTYETEQAVNQQQFDALMQGQQQTNAMLAQALAQLTQAFQQFAAVQSAPRTVTMPDGRTFTAAIGGQGGMH